MKQYRPYDKLALIYDRLMDHVDYEMWSRYIIRLISRVGIKVSSIADLACGTGNFLNLLIKEFPLIYGCDQSEEMLRQAREKNNLQKSAIFLSDLQCIALQTERLDTALLMYDSLNYLADEIILRRALSEISRILKPKGLFIFDVVSREHCINYYADYYENEYWENAGYSRHSFFDPNENIQHNHFRIIIDGFTFLEKHRQRIYHKDFLINILDSISFETLDVFEEFSLEQASDKSERMHFLCQKR